MDARAGRDRNILPHAEDAPMADAVQIYGKST
jgi:hypothetical protein